MSRAISRPCLPIHTQCQPSMRTAANSTPALNSSWPMPAAAAAIASAKAATRQAPTTPATTPANTQRPRGATPLVPAMTMLTTSAASRTSRKTMIAVASMRTPALGSPVRAGVLLLHDDLALGRILVELAIELVGAGIERADGEARFGISGDDLLDI